jgi:16S rRNA (uracil1498-N3)-methyltransferase
VVLFDGCGCEATGEIVDVAGRDALTAVVTQRRTVQPAPAACLTLAVAVCKGPRQRWLVEKVTELGVGGIWPIRCLRSTAVPGRGLAAKWSRWTVEAAKQSGQAWLPQVIEPQDFANVVSALTGFDAAFLASTQVPAQPILTVLATLDPVPARILAVVGPEGGLTEAEENTALEAGVRAVRLGPTTLRVETATVAVAAAVGLWSDHRCSGYGG